jgi:hypothetical protein
MNCWGLKGKKSISNKSVNASVVDPDQELMEFFASFLRDLILSQKYDL